MTAPTTHATPKKALDQRAPSRHDHAPRFDRLSCEFSVLKGVPVAIGSAAFGTMHSATIAWPPSATWTCWTVIFCSPPGAVSLERLDLSGERPGELVEGIRGAVLLWDVVDVGE